MGVHSVCLAGRRNEIARAHNTHEHTNISAHANKQKSRKQIRNPSAFAHYHLTQKPLPICNVFTNVPSVFRTLTLSLCVYRALLCPYSLNEPTPSAMTALHQFGAEMLKLSRGLESVSSAAQQLPSSAAPAAATTLKATVLQKPATALSTPSVVVVVQSPPVKPTIATIDHQLAAIRFVVALGICNVRKRHRTHHIYICTTYIRIWWTWIMEKSVWL